MSSIDRMDPELVEILGRLRGDRRSLLFQGSGGGQVGTVLREPVRPSSASRSTRAAERELLRKHRDELAVWLLRGVSVAFKRDPVISRAYVVEDESPYRRSWEPEEFKRGALIVSEDIGGVPGHGLDEELGALRVLMGGSTRLADAVDACVLAQRLRAFPSGSYMLGLGLLLQGQSVSARASMAGEYDLSNDPDMQRGLDSLGATAALLCGDTELAASSLAGTLERMPKPTAVACLLYVQALAGSGVDETLLERIQAHDREFDDDAVVRAWAYFDTLQAANGRRTSHERAMAELSGRLPENLILGTTGTSS